MLDKVNRANDNFNESIQMNEGKSKYDPKIHWSCRDEIYKNGVLIDVIESQNLVVDSCSVFLAGVVSAKLTNGIQYWAIGSGSVAWDDMWDTQSPPTPTPTTTKLVAEFFRKAITANDITYVDTNGDPSATPTNMIKVTIIVTESEGNGNWREFGLFGGDATVTKDSGIMIDHKLHKILSKTSEISVTRSIVLEF